MSAEVGLGPIVPIVIGLLSDIAPAPVQASAMFIGAAGGTVVRILTQLALEGQDACEASA